MDRRGAVKSKTFVLARLESTIAPAFGAVRHHIKSGLQRLAVKFYFPNGLVTLSTHFRPSPIVSRYDDNHGVPSRRDLCR